MYDDEFQRELSDGIWGEGEDYDMELDDDYMVLPDGQGDSLMYLLGHCVVPVLQQTVLRLLTTIILNVTLGEFIQNGYIKKSASVASIISGAVILMSLVNFYEAVGIIVLFIISYPMCLFASRYRNGRVYLASITAGLVYLVIREHIPFVGTGSWTSTSGIAMIGWMKAMSMVYELSSDQLMEMPSAANYFAYLFHPATIAFGPWVSYSEHCSWMGLFLLPTNYKRWVLLTSWKLLQSFGYLLMSTCFIQWMLADLQAIYLVLIRDALTVRLSHYFVCRLSEALCQLNGPRSPSGVLSCNIVNPIRVELPRSLVDVVIHWNIPMHHWLKKHVYSPLASLGKIWAGLTTFFVSALLHGLSFRVSTVLISLGMYCYIEFTFRDKLAYAMSSCIRARSCGNCDHKFKNSLHVHFINFCFHVLALFNLAYVGVMLDNFDPENVPDGMVERLSYQLSRWNQVGYSSHLIMGGLFALSLLFRSVPSAPTQKPHRG